MHEWIARFGYLAIGVGTFFEGETVLIIGAALAHRGMLVLPAVIASGFLGGVAGDQFWFRVGRRFGPGLLARRPALRRRHASAEQLLRRFGDWFVLGFRFVVGIRTVAPLFFGTTDYRAGRFVALNVLGCGLWATTIGSLGWLLGAGFVSVLKRAGRVEEVIVLVALGLAAAYVLYRKLNGPRHGS